jgi:hypothetical protein
MMTSSFRSARPFPSFSRVHRIDCGERSGSYQKPMVAYEVTSSRSHLVSPMLLARTIGTSYKRGVRQRDKTTQKGGNSLASILLRAPIANVRRLTPFAPGYTDHPICAFDALYERVPLLLPSTAPNPSPDSNQWRPPVRFESPPSSSHTVQDGMEALARLIFLILFALLACR